jgi:hypothetical protein
MLELLHRLTETNNHNFLKDKQYVVSLLPVNYNNKKRNYFGILEAAFSKITSVVVTMQKNLL